MMEIVYNTEEIISKTQFLQKFFSNLALGRHLGPKKRTFGTFLANFADFRLFDIITSKLSYKTIVEIVHTTQEVSF